MHHPLELFEKRLAAKPYCSNHLKKKGLRILPAGLAAENKYIQPNKPNSTNCLVFDIDRPLSPDEITDMLLLPKPSIFVQDRKSGRAHVIYLLNTPVHKNPGSSKKAQAYLEMIRRHFQYRLNADQRYSELVCKNPLSKHWRVYADGPAYDLDELAEYVTLEIGKYSARDAGDEVSIGRNCDLFRKLSLWAYDNVEQYRIMGNYTAWFDMLRNRAGEMNVYSKPLGNSEVRSIAKSVSRWTWVKYSGQGGKYDPEFSDLQRRRGRRGGRPSIGEPWKRDGVSRATWYRKRKYARDGNSSKRNGANREKLASEAKALQGEGYTQSKIASILNISQQHVSRLIAV